MTDREELIKALKCCLKSITECAGPRCPYYYNVGNCIMELKKNSLRFLEEETEEERPRWIPVKEKLPDKEGRYLVGDYGDVLEAQFYLTGQLRRPEWSTTDCYESEDLDHVTHWMPLPCPPEVNQDA
jgi:hypothetical protein